MNIVKPEIIIKAQQGKWNELWKQIIIFLIFFIVITIVQSIPLFIYTFLQGIIIGIQNPQISPNELNNAVYAIQNSRVYIYILLFSNIIPIALTIAFCKFIEKRSVESMGFTKKNILKNYIIGCVIGFVMISAVIILNLLTESAKFDSSYKINGTETIKFVIIYLIAFLIQGASEEIMLRGYLMTSLGAKHNMFIAILVSSSVFALLHIFNVGVNLIAIINITLMGIFLSLYIICFNNIWGACAIHSIWNFAQGNIYGAEVSGINIQDSIFSIKSVQEQTLINGGSFGPEGGLGVSIILVLSIVVLAIYMKKTNKIITKDA